MGAVMDLAYGAYNSINGFLSGPGARISGHTFSCSLQNCKIVISVLFIS